MKIGTHFSEEFEVNIGVHHRSVLSPLLFAIVVDVATNKIKEGMLQEILYTDDSLCSGDHGGTAGIFHSWKSALESKGLKVNLVKTKITVSKIGPATVKSSSQKDPCGICGRKTMVHAVLCKSSGNWIHGTYAKIKRVTNRLAIYIKCRKCRGYNKNVDQKEKLHDDTETVTGFSYLGDRINSGGGCEAAKHLELE